MKHKKEKLVKWINRFWEKNFDEELIRFADKVADDLVEQMWEDITVAFPGEAKAIEQAE